MSDGRRDGVRVGEGRMYGWTEDRNDGGTIGCKEGGTEGRRERRRGGWTEERRVGGSDVGRGRRRDG